jgi:hypothetical protein
MAAVAPEICRSVGILSHLYRGIVHFIMQRKQLPDITRRAESIPVKQERRPT